MQWNGDRLLKEIDCEMGKRLDACATVLQRATKKNIGISARTNGYSKPGEMPHADIKRLQNSIFTAREGMTAIVGVPKGKGVVYGRHLEEPGHLYTPKTKRFMTVPISDEAKKWSNTGNSVWNFPKKLVRIVRPGRAPLLVEVTSNRSKKTRGAWVIHFILLRRVWVESRHFLKPTLDQNMDQIKAILGAPM